LTDVDHFKADAEHYARSDPARAQVAQSIVDSSWAKVAQIDAELEALREQGRHPDNNISESEQIARAFVYEGEFETRRQLAIVQDAERSVARPPEHVRELLGAPPELDGPNRQEWVQLVRESEQERLRYESGDSETLVEPYARDPDAGKELDERIEDFREQQGLERQPPVQAIEQGDAKGVGM
jgi:hypothetical protein